MIIKDLVKLDEHGKFISAVQLSDYDTPVNQSLVESYIFANNAQTANTGQTRLVGSINLLRDMRLAHMNSSSYNRFVVIANYGHGKSHLALVLTNFFAKSYESSEVKAVFKRIEQTLQHNKPEIENFRDFKRQYDRFIVVRLRGDTPRTLREQLFSALKAALKEHVAETQHIEMPFWNRQARQWLEGKVNDLQARQFLRDKFGTDFPNLLKDVENNIGNAYDQYVQLFAHLNNNVAPNADGNVSLREAIIWVVDTFCKNSKPLAGIVILFDEFSQFIQRYSHSKAVGELQDLLQGVQDRPGQAMFLALAQHDPEEVAERETGVQSLQNIKRELSRIDRKYVLHSPIESVINAYLAQSNESWEQLFQEDRRNKGRLYQPSEIVWDIFNKRYDKEFKWTNDHFREVVVKGCFPLHPLTTALLCNLKMPQGLDNDARTILRFIRDRVESRQNESPIKHENLNWVYPIELVDYFGARICKAQDYDAYETAIQNLEQVLDETLTQAHYDILKAMLLQSANSNNGPSSSSSYNQLAILAQMSGHSNDIAIKVLKELADKNIIRFDEIAKQNSFWPIAANPKALEQKIRETINDRQFDDDHLSDLNDKLKTLIPSIERIEVEIDWGHPSDWAATTTILTRHELTPHKLKDLIKPCQPTFQGFKDGTRGIVVWLMALSDDDLRFFSEQASPILKEAFSEETPPPIILVIPQQSNNMMAEQFVRYIALEEIGKDKDAIKEIGKITYEAELEKTEKSLKQAMTTLFGDKENYASIPRKHTNLIVHPNYKPSYVAMKSISIKLTLSRLYELAYLYRPPQFFTDLNGNPKKGASPLRDAVKNVAKNLISNRVPTAMAGMNSMARDRVCKTNLVEQWHLLSTAYYIQEPDILSLKYVWDYLNAQIKPDEQEVQVKNFLPALLNVPYGFDYNTALLLFAAWIGKHNKELRFSCKGKMIGLDSLETEIDRCRPQEFLSKICVNEPLSISRRNADKILTNGRKLINEIQKGVERDQKRADSDIKELRELLTQDICPEAEKEIFRQVIKDLEDSLENAQQYDKDAQKILNNLLVQSDLRKLFSLKSDLKRLTPASLVSSLQPTTPEIEKQLEQKIQQAVEETCLKAEQLNNIESAEANRQKLRDCKDLLQKENFLKLIPTVRDAESNLNDRIKQLNAERDEQALIKRIEEMASSANLDKLYEYKKSLQDIDSASTRIIEKRDKRLNSIANEIENLETFAKSVWEKVSTCNKEEVNKHYEEILKKSNRYVGTSYEPELKKSQDYLGRLKALLGELQTVEQQRKYIHVLSDFKDLLYTVQTIYTSYKNDISVSHLKFIKNSEEEIKKSREIKFNENEGRIEELVDILAKPGADLASIRKSMSHLSQFISPSGNTKLDKLNEQLCQKEAEAQQKKDEKIEKERREKQQREEENRHLKQINGIKTNVDLATLYAHIEDLNFTSEISSVISQAQMKKLNELKAKIIEYEEFAFEVNNNFNLVKGERANKLLEEIKRKRWVYHASKFDANIHNAQKHLEEAADFTTKLKQIEQRKLHTLDDHDSILIEIDHLEEISNSVIVNAFKSEISEARQRIQNRAQQAHKTAEDYIRNIEKDFKSGNLINLRNKINQATGYITPEAHKWLNNLRTQLDIEENKREVERIEKISRDKVVQIEEMFKSIEDIKVRQECVERLQKLL